MRNVSPEPLLRQRFDGHLVDHVVGQILIQIRQAVGILTERLVLATEPVAGSDLAEPLQIDHVEGTNVVFASCNISHQHSTFKSLTIH